MFNTYQRRKPETPPKHAIDAGMLPELKEGYLNVRNVAWNMIEI